METKICTKCGLEKSIDEFYEGRNQCKVCRAEYGKIYSQPRRKNKLNNERTPKEKRRALKIVKVREDAGKLRAVGLKKCTKCNEIKELSEFRYRGDNKGYDPICNKCCNLARRFVVRLENEELFKQGLKRCATCKKVKKLSKFYPESETNRNEGRLVRGSCKKCENRKCNDRRATPQGRLNSAITSGINKSIKDKNSRRWEDLVGYTLQELKARLESQFKDNINWDNYGKWHVDHIIAKYYFNFNSSKDGEFKKCWALDNLRPLWGKENISKSNKIDWDSIYKIPNWSELIPERLYNKRSGYNV